MAVGPEHCCERLHRRGKRGDGEPVFITMRPIAVTGKLPQKPPAMVKAVIRRKP